MTVDGGGFDGFVADRAVDGHDLCKSPSGVLERSVRSGARVLWWSFVGSDVVVEQMLGGGGVAELVGSFVCRETRLLLKWQRP